MDNVLTILLAGGRGTRLDPLTRERAKPAVPFGGVYRIIDFTLSNCVNSGLPRILVLTQYKSLSLDRHIHLGWSRFFHREFGQILDVVPPQQRVSEDWYQGTADAVYQNIYSIERAGADYLLILASDHVYKMDYRRLLRFHSQHGGEATVATLRVPVSMAARQFGIVEVNGEGRVEHFTEKPEHPRPIPGEEDFCLASMGIYVFSTRYLIELLRQNAEKRRPEHDFGHHILPRVIERDRVHAFTYTGRGTGAPAYWRDVGTLDAFHEANMDLLSVDSGLNLHEETWPIYSLQPTLPPPRIAIPPTLGWDAPVDHSSSNLIASGAVVEGGVVGSLIGLNCRVEAGARIENCILFDRVHVAPGAQLRRAILDKGVRVLPGARVGFDPEYDHRRGFTISDGGISCVPKDVIVE